MFQIFAHLLKKKKKKNPLSRTLVAYFAVRQ